MKSFSRRIRKGIKRRIKKAARRNRFIARIVAEIQYIKLQLHLSKKPSLLYEIDNFVEPSQKQNKKYLRHLKKDLLFSRLYYQMIYRQYFLHSFEDLNDNGRQKFMGVTELNMLRKKLASSGRTEVFKNKLKTYEVFGAFFKRDVLVISNASQKDEFVSFVNKHSPCILKPLDKYGGHGILKLEANKEQTPDVLFKKNESRLPFLLEELIIQDPDMAKFHPESINTIRYSTLYNEGKLTKIQAVLRMGTGTSFLDNASSGGIFALVDIATGIIKKPGKSWLGGEFLFHPDSGAQIIGSRIPHWAELNELLEEIVRVLPEHKHVGWDFALSTNGWVLVEGNTLPGLQDYAYDHGMRDELLSIFSSAVTV